MRRKRLRSVLACAVPSLAAALFVWTAAAEAGAHYRPEYERTDLEPILRKEVLDDGDYAILFRQTGLGRSGVEELFDQGRQEELLVLQERFFAPVEYECFQANAVCRSERLIGGAGGEQEVRDFLPTVRTGDILVTFSGHFFGWRSGHAGIVVDAEEGRTLEAVMPGCSSEICALEQWGRYPCFVLLRLKDGTAEETAGIAAYAAENLADIPYSLFSFTAGGKGTQNAGRSEMSKTERAAEQGDMSEAGQSEKQKDTLETGRTDLPEAVSGTQCAHLVWLAFARFGYDLDGDGGFVVTPADLCESGLLEVVQVYGIDPCAEEISGGR